VLGAKPFKPRGKRLQQGQKKVQPHTSQGLKRNYGREEKYDSPRHHQPQNEAKEKKSPKNMKKSGNGSGTHTTRMT